MFNQEKPEVAAAQKVMLEILLEVHRICEKNKLTYFLMSGTLLGAVRHKGFIPWDDDLDIGMPRKDYDKFMEIAQKELPDSMFLQNSTTDREYNIPFAKIRKNGTLLIETGETGNENYHHGIYIDIFPFDYYKYGWFTKWMKWSRYFPDKRKKYPRGSLKRFLMGIYVNIICCIPCKFSIAAREYFAKHHEYFSDSNYKYMSYGLECYAAKDTLKDDILPPVLVDNCFEGATVYLPHNSEMVLKADFGNDYMNLPPVENRKTHAKLIKLDL